MFQMLAAFPRYWMDGVSALQKRAEEAEATEQAARQLLGQLQLGKEQLEVRFAELARKQLVLEHNAASLHGLETTLAQLNSTASQKATQEAHVLVDMRNTLELHRNELYSSQEQAGKLRKQARCSTLPA
jgi:predicted metallo-beta-lactamase superfamily hydrolase